MKRVYGVIGYPISHSLSPIIHNIGFKYHNINAVYGIFETPPEKLEEAIKGIKALGILGVNITIPHKINVIKYLDVLSEEISIFNSVNTIKNDNSKLIGYSTDYYGFIKALTIKNINYKEFSILIIGTGGAAKAIVNGLIGIDKHPKVAIAGRNKEKLLNLKNEIKNKFNYSIEIIDLNSKEFKAKIKENEFNILVNATSVGMGNQKDMSIINKELINSSHIVYDIVYSPLNTLLIKYAKEKNATFIYGIDMLIYQAEKAFNIWTGKELPIDEVKKELEKYLDKE